MDIAKCGSFDVNHLVQSEGDKPMTYVTPARGRKSYTCPHCGVFAMQRHYSVSSLNLHGGNAYDEADRIASSICVHCGEISLWVDTVMVYPNCGFAPMPNEDMPENVKMDYEEAATIAALSPKAAAALLRLAIQKLCVHLGGKGKKINDDIAKLVKDGLPELVQQSLDIVRVVGNDAVHPGQIDFDDQEVVGNLFDLLNIITDRMISSPKKIKGLYSSLPTGALEGINRRDSKSSSE